MTTTRQTLERGEAARLLAAIADLASIAGARIVELAAAGSPPRMKPDRSPATAADDAAEAILSEGLERIFPGVPIVAEESASRRMPEAPTGAYVLVDPVDGTRELVAGRDEYTVNVALVDAGVPRLGVLYAPAKRALYLGGNGEALRAALVPGARFDRAAAVPIRARARPQRLTALTSRSHPDQASARFVARLPLDRTETLGSSLKFARLAEGVADVYARLATVSEWDVAAGHAVLTSAGGQVSTPDGTALIYGRNDEFRVHGFVAWGAPAVS
jgi:3'(2'), 5'-bisphosphate nucleotidase